MANKQNLIQHTSGLTNTFEIRDISKVDTSSEIPIQDMDKLMNDVKKFLKKHPSDIDLFMLSDLILKRLKSDRDFFLSVEGETGTGKSNLMVLLMLIMCRYAGIWRNKKTGKFVKVLPRRMPLPEEWEQVSVSFKMDNNVSFLDETETLQKKFNSIDRYMPFGIDEGSKNLHKQNWQNKLQFKLVQMTSTERWQNKAFFICFPNFKELNTNFRNDRIHMRIYIYVRYTGKNFASAILSVKDPSRWTSDPWHMQDNERTFEAILKRIPAAFRSPDHIVKAERKLKGYAGEFHIPNLRTLCPKIWNMYYKLKIENATKELNQSDKPKENKYTQKYKYAIKKMMAFIKIKFPNIKYADFTKITNIPASSLSTIWNEKLDIEDEYSRLAEAKKMMGR